MDETLVFLDEGLLYKLSEYFGKIKFDRIKFSEILAAKQRLICKKIFYYNVPPFQSEIPTLDEEKRKKGYDKFIRSLSRHGKIIVREGRCQRLKIGGKFTYGQKGVDVLLAMDLSNVPIKYPEIRKIILISSDSDFVPIIKNLKEQEIKTLLYTFYETKDRRSIFSTSNELIKSVYKYVLLTKQDFENSALGKKEAIK